MTRNSLLVLATILTSLTTAGLVLAGSDGPRPQTRAIETEAEVRNLVLGSPKESTGERHLSLSERLTFEPADPALGPLERAILDVEIHLEQGFSGLVGDAGPLEEAPEPVSIAADMTTRLEIVGPDGSHLLSTMMPSAVGRCAARGSCTFTHHERRSVEMRFEPPVSAFEGEGPVTLIVRATTTGGVLSQLCGQPETWERCQIRQARIGVTVPKDGIKLTYMHEGASQPAAATSGATVPTGTLAGLAAGVVLLIGGGLALYRWSASRRTAAADPA